MTDSSTLGERAEVSGTQLVQLTPEQLQAMLQAAGRAAAEETLKSLRDSDAIPTNRLPASASAGRPTLVAFCGVSGALLLHLWVVLGLFFSFLLSCTVSQEYETSTVVSARAHEFQLGRIV